MNAWRVATVVLAAGAVLCGCDPASQPKDAPAVEPAAAAPQSARIPTQAQLDQYRAEGPDPTLRKIASIDYWLNYKLLEATGAVKELGGEEAAVNGLKAIGDAYERRLRVAEVEMPKMLRVMSGEGITSGFTGMTIGSFLSTVTSGMLSGAVSNMSDAELSARSKAGPMKYGGKPGDNGMAEMELGSDGSLRQTIEFTVEEQGLSGKVRTNVRMDGCPNADGRVAIDVEVDSQMSVSGKPATGGYLHTNFHYERYLDDDAHFSKTDDASASSLRIRLGGHENSRSQSTDVTIGYDRAGQSFLSEKDTQGFGLFGNEDKDRAIKLIKDTQLLQTLMAEASLRGLGSKAGPPWEGGHCIDLKVMSDPAKRSHVRPNTAFDLEAIPRVKSDGTPAGGNVVATLTGGSHLQPAGMKVKADAKFEYAGPAEKNETAGIYFESRSKRGVGKATLDFDTKAGQHYQMSGGARELHFSGMVCNVEETFYLHSDTPLTEVDIRFEPASRERGKYSYSGNMSGFDDKGKKYTFRVHGKGKYELRFDGDVAVSVAAEGLGTVETPYGPQDGYGREKYLMTLKDGDCESNASVTTLTPK
jgi:hypothetical protein